MYPLCTYCSFLSMTSDMHTYALSRIQKKNELAVESLELVSHLEQELAWVTLLGED
jgi:hypothetical protein